MPLCDGETTDAAPGEKAIGEGLYEYLCLFPECDHADEYVRILRQAYPFLINDIASELIVLDVKGVDLEGTRRKAVLLKILLHLEPENFGLLYKTGVTCYELSLDYAELQNVDSHLQQARILFERARKVNATDPANLNYLGQVCYLTGHYHQAKVYWQLAADNLEDETSVAAILRNLGKITHASLPDPPLAESLRQVGDALENYNQRHYSEACIQMEAIAQNGSLLTELPDPEFYYLLGLCREKCHDRDGAGNAFRQALALDQHHQPSLDALARVDSEQG